MQNKYPLWKNLLLVVIAVLGFIYAIPNLYIENPVVQISAENHVDAAVLAKQVETILKQNKLGYSSITLVNDGVSVLFKSTDAQLLAKDARSKLSILPKGR